MKMGYWMVTFVAMMIFLEFAGISTSFGTTLAVFGVTIDDETHELENADTSNSAFWAEVILILGLAGTASLVVGWLTKTYDTSLILVGLCTWVGLLFVSTGWRIIQLAQKTGETWITALVVTIFAPMMIAFVMSCVDYFGGR